MNEHLKNTLVNFFTKKIVEYALLKVPYLAWGPFSWITTKVVEKVITKAIEFGILEAGVALVKREVNKEVDTVREVTEKYTDDKTEDQLKELDDELTKAFDDLFKF